MVFGQHFYGNFINLTCQSKASVFKTPQENYPKEVKSKPKKGAFTGHDQYAIQGKARRMC